MLWDSMVGWVFYRHPEYKSTLKLLDPELDEAGFALVSHPEGLRMKEAGIALVSQCPTPKVSG